MHDFAFTNGDTKISLGDREYYHTILSLDDSIFIKRMELLLVQTGGYDTFHIIIVDMLIVLVRLGNTINYTITTLYLSTVLPPVTPASQTIQECCIT